jgi:hypothetical protein
MKIYTVLVTGSRSWRDGTLIAECLAAVQEHIRNQFPESLFRLIEGGASGADTLARAAAHTLGWEIITVPAKWEKLGKVAGSLRNQEMVDMKPDVCFAFPTAESRGTWDCVNRCKAAKIPVHIKG